MKYCHETEIKCFIFMLSLAAALLSLGQGRHQIGSDPGLESDKGTGLATFKFKPSHLSPVGVTSHKSWALHFCIDALFQDDE